MIPIYMQKAIPVVVARKVGLAVLLLVPMLGTASAIDDPFIWTYNKVQAGADAAGIPFNETYAESRSTLIGAGEAADAAVDDTLRALPVGGLAVEHSTAQAIRDTVPDMAETVPKDPSDAVPERQNATAPVAGLRYGLLWLPDGRSSDGVELPQASPEADADAYALDTGVGRVTPEPGSKHLPAPQSLGLHELSPAPGPTSAGSMAGVMAATTDGSNTWLDAMASGAGLLLLLSAVLILGRLFGVGLFSRFNEDTVLKHPQRQRLWDVVRERPGIRVHEAAELLELEVSLARHHLNLMERQGVIVTLDWQRGKHLFENHGRYRAEERLALAALQRPMMAKIVRALIKQPGVNQRELSATIDAAPSLVHWHVTRLMEAGLVEKRREGRAMLHLPTEAARTLLQT